MNAPQLLDLFCGAGGMSLGAARAGFKLLAGVDFDQRALSAHELNFPGSKHLKLDLSKTSSAEVLQLADAKQGQVDVLVGGPPCQGFSSIGRRDPSDIRNELINHYFRFVSELKPKAFLMENVPGVLHADYSEFLNSALDSVRSEYTILKPHKLRAVEAGAPTIRQRVFIVGFRKDLDTKAEGFWERLALKNSLAPTVRHALDGLPFDVNVEFVKNRSTRRVVNISRSGHFFDRISGHIPDGVGSPAALEAYFRRSTVSGCIGTVHSPEIVARYAALKYGQADPKTKSVRLNPNGYCPTLRAGTGPEKGSFQAVRPIHYLRPRVITPREAARLQGFPDWYEFDHTKWHAFRQIGNSVSPFVSEFVLAELKTTLGL